ncbi:hypothetical protein [Reticulibacter mediterranei]|nr:hypothetical protein [Reticulibacter mediterranei]
MAERMKEGEAASAPSRSHAERDGTGVVVDIILEALSDVFQDTK